MSTSYKHLWRLEKWRTVPLFPRNLKSLLISHDFTRFWGFSKVQLPNCFEMVCFPLCRISVVRTKLQELVKQKIINCMKQTTNLALCYISILLLLFFSPLRRKWYLGNQKQKISDLTTDSIKNPMKTCLSVCVCVCVFVCVSACVCVFWCGAVWFQCMKKNPYLEAKHPKPMSNLLLRH